MLREPREPRLLAADGEVRLDSEEAVGEVRVPPLTGVCTPVKSISVEFCRASLKVPHELEFRDMTRLA